MFSSILIPQVERYAVLLKDVLSIVHRILRQVCDEHGAIMPHAVTAWGKGSLQPAVDHLVAISNKLTLVLLVTAQVAFLSYLLVQLAHLHPMKHDAWLSNGVRI